MPNLSGKSAAAFIGKAARFFTINPLFVGFYANKLCANAANRTTLLELPGFVLGLMQQPLLHYIVKPM